MGMVTQTAIPASGRPSAPDHGGTPQRMERRFLFLAVLAAALCGEISGARGAPASAGESPHHEALVRAEIGLEEELRAAAEEGGWVLPLPRPAGAPRVDGDLAED